MSNSNLRTLTYGQLTKLAMVSGNEAKYSTIIHDGKVKEWVGIGWIEIRDADYWDRKKFPTVVEASKRKRKKT